MTELIALLPHSIYYRPTTTAHNVTRMQKKRRNTIEWKRLEKGPREVLMLAAYAKWNWNKIIAQVDPVPTNLTKAIFDCSRMLIGW